MPEPKPQSEKFKDLSRDLEANEDEAAFEETLKRIAPKGLTPKGESE